MIKKIGYRIAVIMLLVMAGHVASAQITAPITQKEDGKKYYAHTVEEGQTLWQIKSAYKVPINDIKAANPEITNWDLLGIGDIIFIPVTKQNKKPENLPAITADGVQHTVAKGETLSQIAEKYNLKLNDILEANPTVVDANSVGQGQVLIIPVDKSEDVDTTAVTPATTFTDSLITHLVMKGETLFGIAKKYDVKEVDIIGLNPRLESEPLQIGQQIRIPKLNPLYKPNGTDMVTSVVPTTVNNMVDTSIMYKTYNVAIMLPFFLDKNDAIQTSIDPTVDKSLYVRSRDAYDFYHGALLAIDSLKQKGLSVNLYVYDTGGDNEKVKSILKKLEMEEMHIIFGPLYASNVKLVAAYAKEHKISMVSPVSKGSKVLLDNPYVSKVTPSNTTQVMAMAEYVVEHHRGDNVLLVDSKKKKDKLYVSVFKREYEENVSGKSGTYRDSLTIRTSEANSIKALSGKFKKDMLNVIVLPSRDLAYVSHFFTMMAGLKENVYKDYRFMIFGMEDWINYDDINIISKHNYDLHVVASNYVNYSDTVVLKPFILDYRKTYKGKDPGRFSLMGFDVAWYYLYGMMHYGTGFPRQFGVLPQGNTLYTNFAFKKTGAESGFENQNVYVLQFSNYNLIQK